MAGSTSQKAFLAMEEKIWALEEQGQLDSAIALSYDYTALAQREDNVLQIVQGYNMQGYLSTRQEAYGQAIILYLEAARYGEDSKDQEVLGKLISTFKNSGRIMSLYSHYDMSIRLVDQGLDLAKQIGDTSEIISLQYNKSNTLRRMHHFDVALDLIYQTLLLCKAGSENFLKLNNSLGATFFENKELDQALEAYRETLSTARENNHQKFISWSLNNIGEVLYHQGKYGKAIGYLEEANQIKRETGLTSDLLNGLELAGLNYLALKDYSAALAHFQEAEQYLPQAELLPDYFELYKHIGAYYTTIGDHYKAGEYHQKYMSQLEKYLALRSDIENQDKQYQMELITQRYFDLLEARQETEDMQQVAAMIGGASLAFILFVFSIGSYRRLRLKRSLVKSIREIEQNSPV